MTGMLTHLLLGLLPLYRSVQLAGPESTPYAGGWFNVELLFTERFPGEQPTARFVTKIWHPNIRPSGGEVCVALGNGRNGVGHRSVFSVVCVLLGLQMLLSTLSPDRALNSLAASQIRADKQEFEKRAKEWTRRYAV